MVMVVMFDSYSTCADIDARASGHSPSAVEFASSTSGATGEARSGRVEPLRLPQLWP